MAKTIVIGASTKPERYSYKAVDMLKKHNHQVVAIGAKQGTVLGEQIISGKPAIKNVDTITMYINSQRQSEYYDYILSLKPRRVIFNPGTENREFETILKENNIEVLIACTLVLLSTNQF